MSIQPAFSFLFLSIFKYPTNVNIYNWKKYPRTGKKKFILKLSFIICLEEIYIKNNWICLLISIFEKKKIEGVFFSCNHNSNFSLSIWLNSLIRYSYIPSEITKLSSKTSNNFVQHIWVNEQWVMKCLIKKV